MESSSKGKEIDPDQLVEYAKALKDYKKNGVKQAQSILIILLEAELTMNQLKESKIGASLSKLAKEDPTDPEEKELKELAIKLFKKCKKEDKSSAQPDGSSTTSTKTSEKPPANGNNTEGKKEEKKPPTEEKKPKHHDRNPFDEEKKSSSDERKEAKKSPADPFSSSSKSENIPKKSHTEQSKRESAKDSVNDKRKEAPPARKSESSGSGDKLPLLSPDYRNFTLKSFVDGLLMDFKTNPAEKEKMKPMAQKKAVEIERALNEKVKGIEDSYRMEARNLSTFLVLKNNLELRKLLMESDGDSREFVYNKENFLNQAAREKIEKTSRRLIDAANADYDKKIVRESELYQCKNCKSRRISKTEKQTRSGDEPMTSFFTCVDCGKGWKE